MDEGVTHDPIQQSPAAESPAPDLAPQEPVGVDEAEAGTGLPEAEAPAQSGKQYIPKDRFDQVYARTKDAEVKLQQERETRARLEGELEALKRQPPPQAAPTPPRYSATQLQAMIDEGKATVGQVLAYQEESLRMEMDRKLEEKVQAHLSTSAKTSSLQQELARYRSAIPEVAQVGTPERVKAEQEFNYLVGIGYDAKDPRTELMALRVAHGSIESIEARRTAKTIPTGRETMQDIQSPGGVKQSEPDVLKKMTAAQRQHYQKMLDRGVYKGWDEVREELKEYATPGGR